MQSESETLDMTGAACPLPLLRAKYSLSCLHPGAVLKVITTDPGSVRDFHLFCKQGAATLEKTYQEADRFVFWLKKAVYHENAPQNHFHDIGEH